MADQDFRINIVTLADLTGIKLTQAQLDALNTAAASGNIAAIEALKKLKSAQQDAVQVLKERKEAEKQANDEMTRGFRAAAGYGLLIGGVVAKAINDFANAQNKVTKELDEQAALLVKNVQEWNKLAQASGSMEQLATAGEKATSQIDALKKAFNDANTEVLGINETIQDTLFKTFRDFFHGPLLGGPGGAGPFQALLDERIKGLMLDLATAQEKAASIFGQRFQEIKDIGAGIDPVIEKVTRDLEQAKSKLSGIGPGNSLKDWADAEQVVIRLTQRLAELNKQRQAMVQAGQPTTRAGVIQGELQNLNRLQNLPISTTDETILRNAQVDTEKRLRDQQIADEARSRSLDSSAMGRARSFLTPPRPGESPQDINAQILSKLDALIQIWR